MNLPPSIIEAINRIVAVPMYCCDCSCEPPGHEKGCSGARRVEDAYDFASAQDRRAVAAFLRSQPEPDHIPDAGKMVQPDNPALDRCGVAKMTDITEARERLFAEALSALALAGDSATADDLKKRWDELKESSTA